MRGAFLQSFPEKSYQTRCDGPHRFSWFIQGLRDHLGFLGEVSKQYDTIGNKLLFKNYQKIYNNSIKESKKAANDRLILSSKNPTRCMWDIINSQRGKLNNKKRGDPGITPDQFNDFFVNIAYSILQNIPATQTDPLARLEAMVIPDIAFRFEEVSFNTVRDIIDSLQNKNSADAFGLSVRLLKVVKSILITPLTKLINLCIRSSVFPRTFKRALVTPILKKGDSTDVSNYRPISLLPILSKVLEKCMSLQITAYFEQNNLFSDKQFGFREGRGTVLGILDLISGIMDAFEEHNHCMALFCDMCKAFDCVSHDLLLSKLKFYKFKESSILLLKSYLSDRTKSV